MPKFLDDNFTALQEAERRAEANRFYFPMHVDREDIEALIEMNLLTEEDRENPEAIALHARSSFSSSISDAKKLRERKAEVAAGTGPVDVALSCGAGLVDWLIQSGHLLADRRRDTQAIAVAIKDALWRQAMEPYQMVQAQKMEKPLVGTHGTTSNWTGQRGVTTVYGPQRFG
jgi:hypothetical protein